MWCAGFSCLLFACFRLFWGVSGHVLSTCVDAWGGVGGVFGWGELVVGCPWVCCVLIFPVSLLTRDSGGGGGGVRSLPAQRPGCAFPSVPTLAHSAARFPHSTRAQARTWCAVVVSSVGGTCCLPATRPVHCRSFLPSRAFSRSQFLLCSAVCLGHRRSFLPGCACSTVSHLATRLVHRRS